MRKTTEKGGDADGEDQDLLAKLVLVDPLPAVLDGGDDDFHGGELAVHPQTEHQAEEHTGPNLGTKRNLLINIC